MMTALRQQAFEMLEALPEENLFAVIQFMQSANLKSIESREERLNRKRIAFEELKSLCKPIPDLDYDKALDEYMEEKFGNSLQLEQISTEAQK